MSVSLQASAAKPGRVAAATFIGTAIEWYDFYIYGSAAAIVFGPQFFTNLPTTAALIASFGTFAAGFMARPIGGILFGHFGDRFGRKNSLVASLLLMGFGTLCIALLPTYAQIGVAAPILLIVLRLLQGLGVGGEWGGAVLMASEHAPTGKRALFASFPQMGIPAGIIASNLVFLLTTLALGPERFFAWGWRIPFLFSALLVITALFIRLRLEESPAFEKTKEHGNVRRLPILDVIKQYPRNIALGTGVSLAPSVIGYLFSVYLLSHGTQIDIPQRTMLLLITSAAIVFLLAVVLAGRIADRVSPYRIFLIGSGASAVAIFPAFAMFDTGTVPGALLALILLTVLLGPMVGVQGIIVTMVFPASMRYSGSSLAYQLGSVIGGGLTPAAATAIYAATGTTTAIAAYVAGMALISLLCVALLPRVARRTIEVEATVTP